MPKPYMVRINFPRQVVTVNKGTKNEFKTPPSWTRIMIR